MIEIKNLRNEKPIEYWQVKVDRSSPLGNPFVMHSEEYRNEVCDNYKNYFYNAVNKKTPIKDEIDKLFAIYMLEGKLELFCWCSPKRCHAEIIKSFLLEKASSYSKVSKSKEKTCWRKGGCLFNSNNSLRYMKCWQDNYSIEECEKDWNK